MGRGRGGNRGGRPQYGSLGENKVTENAAEFNRLVGSAEYDASRSYLSPSGGFVVTHRDHNAISDTSVNKEDEAARMLADLGFRVYMDSEIPLIKGRGVRDGRIETRTMDIKTINSVGSRTVANQLSDTGDKKQSQVAILYRNTGAVTEKYVRDQIARYKQHRTAGDVLEEVFYLDGKKLTRIKI